MFKLSFMEGIKNIDKNRTLTFLTVLLFTFLFLLQGYTYSYRILNTEMQAFVSEESFSKYQVYCFSARFPLLQVYRIEGYDTKEIRKDFSELLQALDKIENLNYNIALDTDIDILDYKIPKKALREDGSVRVPALTCSPSFHKTENYRVIMGRRLTAEDSVYVEGEPRKVLLGYKYKDYYNIGDIIKVVPGTTYDKHFYSLEVVGILAEDTTYMDCWGESIYDLDNFIVYPALWLSYDELSNYEAGIEKNCMNMQALDFANIKMMIKEEHVDDVIGEVQQALNNFLTMSKYFRPVSSKYALEKMESRSAAITEFSSTITIVLMVFAFITVLISIVNRVSRNLKDYSIHIALGASRGNIVGFVVSEMSLILLCSIILGTAVTRVVTLSLYIYFDLFKFLGVYIATSLFVLLISAITAVIAIKKSDICTLIK